MQREPRYEIRVLDEGVLSSVRALFRALVDEDTAYKRAPAEFGEGDFESSAEWDVRVLGNPNNVFLVAVTRGTGEHRVIGFVRFLQDSSRKRTRHTGSLTLGVGETYRSKGIGQALLDALLEALRESEIERVSLQVFKDNDRAVRFYERNGFVASGTLPGEIKMEDGRYRDLILMHRWIK